MRKITISMNEETKRELEKASERIGVSQSAYISMLIRRAETEYHTGKVFEQINPEQIKQIMEERNKA